MASNLIYQIAGAIVGIVAVILLAKYTDSLLKLGKALIYVFVVSIGIFWLIDIIIRLPDFMFPVFMLVMVGVKIVANNTSEDSD
jgi:hypothetical protein